MKKQLSTKEKRLEIDRTCISEIPPAGARFIRLGEQDRALIQITVDGEPITALEGDTLMTAILTHQRSLRRNNFSLGRRAGFCLMGACQDCWVWSHAGERMRSCSTYVAEGMDIYTQQAEETWQVHES
jgi:predicted molibdopterin-dependent oxidoreductase YjgC